VRRAPPVLAPFNPTFLTTADFNNDNKLDVAAVGNSANVVVLFGNGDGTFSTYTPLIPGTTSHSSVVAADFNNDGWVDLAVSQVGSNHQLAQLLNLQNGSFNVPSFFELNTYGGQMIPGHFLNPTNSDLIMTPANGSVGFGVTFAGGPIGLTRTDPPPSLPAKYRIRHCRFQRRRPIRLCLLGEDQRNFKPDFLPARPAANVRGG